mmetsp:Transcript_26403/g.59111  ORF Transcript_26403/g.59111 Transcript_26403/m.59111 type:complete len:209 (+) Transcript_26403:347-973(+)
MFALSAGSRAPVLLWRATHAVPAPFVSKPTPTPSIAASIRKQNGSAAPRGFRPRPEVLTKAQLLRAAKVARSSVTAVPMAHRPRPGGRNRMWNTSSNISRASELARFRSKPRPLTPSQCRHCRLKQPSTTRRTVSCHCSERNPPVSRSATGRLYVRRYTSSPRPLKPKGGRSSAYCATNESSSRKVCSSRRRSRRRAASSARASSEAA